MIGKLLNKIREDKNKTNSYLSNKTNVDVGYITHIIKEERIPSHKVLKKICEALKVPYQQIMYSYDKVLSEEQLNDNYLDFLPYHSVVAVNSLDDLINCPCECGTASFAIRIKDNSMEPRLLKGTYAFVEQMPSLADKDIGLFYHNGDFLIRRFSKNSSSILLKPENNEFKKLYINIDKNDEDFYIIGKILGTNDDF